MFSEWPLVWKVASIFAACILIGAGGHLIEQWMTKRK